MCSNFIYTSIAKEFCCPCLIKSVARFIFEVFMSLLVYEDQGIAFVHIPKSGGTSVTNALILTARQGGWAPLQHKLYTHADFVELKKIVSDSFISNAKIFSVIRNPWDRLVSLYEFRLARALERIRLRSFGHVYDIDLADDLSIVEQMQGLGFCRWLQSSTLHEARYGIPITRKSQLSWCRDESGRIGVSNILLLEAIDMEFLSLVGVNSLPHMNKSKRSPDQKYQSYYDFRSREFVEFYFGEDIEFGSYVF